MGFCLHGFFDCKIKTSCWFETGQCLISFAFFQTPLLHSNCQRNWIQFRFQCTMLLCTCTICCILCVCGGGVLLCCLCCDKRFIDCINSNSNEPVDTYSFWHIDRCTVYGRVDGWIICAGNLFIDMDWYISFCVLAQSEIDCTLLCA